MELRLNEAQIDSEKLENFYKYSLNYEKTRNRKDQITITPYLDLY